MEPLKNGQTILRKTNRIGDITLSAFRPCYKDTVIRIEWHRKRNIDQQNRIKSLEAYTHTYGKLIHVKGVKNIHGGKDSIFNKWCSENWMAAWRKNEIRTFSNSIQK